MLGLEEGHQLWPGLQQVSHDGVEGQLQVQGGRDAQEEDGSVDVLGVIFFDKDWFADTGEEELGIFEFASRSNKLLVLVMHRGWSPWYCSPFSLFKLPGSVPTNNGNLNHNILSICKIKLS